MLEGVKKCGFYFEYFPLMMIGLFFVAEAELDHKLMSIGWNVILALLIVVILFLAIRVMNMGKKTMLLTMMLLWIVLIYVKRCYLQPVTVIK